MPNVRIKGLGGVNEIGAKSSQIEFLNVGRNILLDSGIKMLNRSGGHGGSEGHAPPDVRIDAALITHGHSDHHGNLPNLWPGIVAQNPEAKVYMTKPTFYIASNLWVNSSYLMNSGKIDASNEVTFNRGTNMIYKQAQQNLIEKPKWVELFPGVDAYFGPNGHIRGSAFIVIRVDIGNGKYIYIMFSGDISVYDSPTVRGMRIPEEFIDKIDLMFVESTYGDRVLIPRAEEEDRMAYLAKKTIVQGGICLAPAFGVGRSPDAAIAQEIRGVHPYVDGMAQTFLDLCADPDLGYWCELDHLSGVELARSGIKYVEGRDKRKDLMYEGGGVSVISTAGMMVKGSCAWQYVNENYFLEKPLNTVLQTGYQAEGTEGWDLRDAVKHGKKLRIGRRDIMVRASVPEQLQLSSHADGEQIADIVNTLRPKKVFIDHGNDNGREGLKKKLLNLGFRGEIRLPNNGDIIEV